MLKLLLDASADADRQGDQGNTAVACAAQAGQEEMVQLLLAAGSMLRDYMGISWEYDRV